MKPRHIALGVALVVAAGFAVFGDKTPAGAVVSSTTDKAGVRSDIQTFKAPNVRMSDLTPAVAHAASAPAPASNPKSDVVILRLEPRETLIADAGEAQGEGAA